ncbi:LysR substrate-binding domain-containing protein [Streptomyces shaanxiensis]
MWACTSTGSTIRRAAPRREPAAPLGIPESFDLLFEGAIDLAVVEATPHNPPLSDPRYDQQPLLDDPFDLVVPEGHPLAHRDRVDLADAAHEDWIAPAGARAARTSCRPAARPASPRAWSTTPSSGTSPHTWSPTAWAWP